MTTPYDENGLPQTASLTSYFFGGVYEVTGDTIRKYYSFAGQTIAVRNIEGETNTLSYLLTDHLGSVVAVTDDSGTLTTQQRYLPFGGERQLPHYATTELTDYTYTGQRELDEGMGGLTDYKARFYSPYLNRFLQPDSIIPNPSNPQSWNRFSYGLNNPSRYTDPSGHAVECGIYAGTSCAGVGPIQPTIVRDKNGITISKHMDIPQEDVINGVNTTWEFTTTVYSFIFEPIDWVVSGAYCVQGECSLWMLFGLLPGVSGSAAKRLPDVFSVIKYGDNAAGLAKHHGVLDVWAASNIPGYISRNPHAPAVVLTREMHEKANDVFRTWRKEVTGSITGKIDWTTVSPRTVQWLSEKMFDAAEVSREVRQTYYNEFYRYLYEVLP